MPSHPNIQTSKHPNICGVNCLDVWMAGHPNNWPRNVWMFGCLDVWMFGCLDGWTSKRLAQNCLDVWMFGWLDIQTIGPELFGCLDVWMFGWLDIQTFTPEMFGCLDVWIAGSHWIFCVKVGLGTWVDHVAQPGSPDLPLTDFDAKNPQCRITHLEYLKLEGMSVPAHTPEWRTLTDESLSK